MAIAHLEDLPLDVFLKVVQNISTYHASEKLDGANLWLGVEKEGKLFTSREGKSDRAKRFYDETEYPEFAAYNGFRSAHAALQAKEEDIKRVLMPGQMVELEVLYGRQPNAVTYGAEGKSYIAFLRGVNGTPDTVADQLSMSLGGQTAKVSVAIVTTPDGESLETTNTEVTYQFTGAQKIDPSALKDVDLARSIAKLNKFLEAPSGFEELTNMELVKTSLGTIKTDKRQKAKDLKTKVIAAIMSDHKIPIKQDLLKNYVRKIKPALADKELSDSEDLGIEGVVLRDPETSDLVKLVDKDTFTTINAFNHHIRNQISNVIKTTDPDAPLEARGGVVGDMRIKIADLLGNSDLARGATAKRAFDKVKGKDPIATIKASTANLNLTDWIGTKKKLLLIVQQAVANLKNLLQDFKDNKENFRLKLKNGKVIGISEEIEKRTYLVFAESIKNVIDLHQKLRKAKTLAQVIAYVYGHLAKQVHEAPEKEEKKPEVETPTETTAEIALADVQKAAETPVKEELLTEKKADTDKRQYSKDAFSLLNIYFATVFMAAIIYMVDDKKGIKILKDKTHYRMDKWSKDMSPVNFWGYVIWRGTQPAVKKLLGPKVAAQLYKTSRKVPPNNWRAMHLDFASAKEDNPIEWSDHRKTMRVLQHFDGMNTDRINILMEGVFNFEGAPFDKKVKTLSKLFYYAYQYIPTSPLIVRLKAIQNGQLLNPHGEQDLLVQEMKLLAEIDSMSGGGPDISGLGPVGAAEQPAFPAVGTQGNNSNLQNATRAGDANATAVQGKKRHNVIRRKRNPDIIRIKFPKPKDDAKTKDDE